MEIINKLDDKATFYCQSKKDIILGLLVLSGFVVILTLICIWIFNHDWRYILMALKFFIILLPFIITFSALDYLVFDRQEKIVFFYNNFRFYKFTSIFCSFDKIKEIKIKFETTTSSEGKESTKVCAQILTDAGIINSDKRFSLDNTDFDRNTAKALMEEALNVWEIVDCPFKYIDNLPEEASKIIHTYKNKYKGTEKGKKIIEEDADPYRNLKPVTGYAGQYEDEKFWDKEKKLPHSGWWKEKDIPLARKYHFNYPEQIISIIAHPDGDTVIIGTHEGIIHLISLRTHSMKGKIESAGKLNYLQLHANGKLLIGKEEEYSSVIIWDIEMGKKLHTFSAGGIFKGLHFYPDRERIKLLKKHGETTWNIYTGRLLNKTERELMHEDGYDFKFSHPGGKIKMECHMDCLKINNKTEKIDCPSEESKKYFYNQFKPLYYYDGCDFIARAYGNNAAIFNVTTGKKYIFSEHTGTVKSLSIHYPLAVTGGDDKILKIWNLETEKCIATWRAESSVTGVAVSPTGFVIYGTDKGKVEILEIHEAGE